LSDVARKRKTKIGHRIPLGWGKAALAAGPDHFTARLLSTAVWETIANEARVGQLEAYLLLMVVANR
jgi:hypothetical protein